jgi:hypothetical protein
MASRRPVWTFIIGQEQIPACAILNTGGLFFDAMLLE